MDTLGYVLLCSFAVTFIVEVFGLIPFIRATWLQNLLALGMSGLALWKMGLGIDPVLISATSFLAITLRILLNRVTSKPQVIPRGYRGL